jgi:hypothetical protein
MARQKSSLVPAASDVVVHSSSHSFIAEGLGLNILGGLDESLHDNSSAGGGDGGDMSGFLAALDLSVSGMEEPVPLAREVRAAIPTYIETYWLRFQHLYPIVHRRSFDATADDVLQCAMAAVATQYLDSKEDRTRGNQLHEFAWQVLIRVRISRALLLLKFHD